MRMRLLGVLSSLLSFAIIGCAAGTSSSGTSTTAAVTPANLGGNWLLAGSLPANTYQPSSTFGLAATFDVTESQVTGIAYASDLCGSSSFFANAQAMVVTGTVSTDGTFSLTTPSPFTTPPTTTLSIQGKVPGAAGIAWAGTYSIAGSCTNPFTNVVQPLALSGAIQSTSLPLLNGTYGGALSASTPGSTAATSVSLKLQQGGFEPNTATGAQGPYSNILLSGTVILQGTSCQLTGTTQGATIGSIAAVSDVFGDTISGFFLMSDGSQIGVIGNMADTKAAGLSVIFTSTPSKSSCPIPLNLVPITLTLQ